MQEVAKLEDSLWSAADRLRQGSNLTSSEYCMPVLGVIFLRHAANRYETALEQIEDDRQAGRMPKRPLVKGDFLKRRALLLPKAARYDELLKLPKGENLGAAIRKAMDAIERDFEPLLNQLPKDYDRFDNDLFEELLRIFDSEALRTASGDVFGRIYEYFLMKFAMQGAQDNGEFFTPPSLVQTIVNVIEPDHGTVFDPACGSGGMFVQSSHFIERLGQDTTHRVTFYGQEKTGTTIRLAKMNLAVHGLEGDIREANTAHVVRGKPGVADDFYITALLNNQNIAGFITGVAQPKQSQQNLKQIKVTLPDYPTQRQIAETLSAYDELMENNRRRMALLEESARLLYREWFVRLRFPGHEHTRLVNGVPEGWEVRGLGQCAKFLSGGTPSKARSDFWEGDIPWVSSGEMTSQRIHDVSLHVTSQAVEAGSRLVPSNTILAVVRGMSLAKEFRVCITVRAVAFNQDLKAFACEPGVDPVYLFNALLAQRDQIRDRATEASHGTKKLDTPVLASVPILVPSPTWQARFREFVDPLNSQWDNLYQQNEKLRAARDLLLPRLMSGEIAV